MRCAECGAEIVSGAVFCIRCGARVQPQWQDDGAEEQTVTVVQPTVRHSGARLEPPSAAEQRDLDAPPIVAASSDPETGAVPVDAVAVLTSWYLLLPDGVRVEVGHPVLLGRRPTEAGAPPSTRLVTVPDPEGTVSRDHALLEPANGTLKLTNVSRKNTIPVAWPDGVRYNVVPGEHLVIANMCAMKLGTVPVLLQRS